VYVTSATRSLRQDRSYGYMVLLQGGSSAGATEIVYTELTDTSPASADTWEQWGTEELRFTQFDGRDVSVKADLVGHIKHFSDYNQGKQSRIQISLDDGSTWSDSHSPEIKANISTAGTTTRWLTGATFVVSGTVTTAVQVRAQLYQSSTSASTWSNGGLSAIVVALSGSSAVTTYYAKVEMTSGFSVTNDSFVSLEWDAVVSDTQSMWAGGNPKRLTAPTDGLYMAKLHWSMASGTHNALFAVISKNSEAAGGGDVADHSYYRSTYTDRGEASGIVSLDSGDYVAASFYQDGSAAKDLLADETFFELLRLGPLP